MVNYTSLRKQLLLTSDYVGGKEFLHQAGWQRLTETSGALHGLPPSYKKRCTVVGHVPKEGALLGPLGDFSEQNGIALEDARRHFDLISPGGLDGFEDDFTQAVKNLRDVALTIPGYEGDETFVGQTSVGEVCLHLDYSIFGPKGPQRYRYAMSEIDVDKFLVPEEVKQHLRKMCKTHETYICATMKNQQRMEIGEIEVYLPGSLVLVTFCLGYDTGRGLKADLESIELLE